MCKGVCRVNRGLVAGLAFFSLANVTGLAMAATLSDSLSYGMPSYDRLGLSESE